MLDFKPWIFCLFFKNLIEIYSHYFSPPLTSYSFYINHCYKNKQMYQHINKPVESLWFWMCVYVSKAGLLASYYQSRGSSLEKTYALFLNSVIICRSSSHGRAPSMPPSTSECQLKLFMSSLSSNVTKVSCLFLPHHCQKTLSHTDVLFWLSQTLLVPFCEVSQILGTRVVL